ncbi:purine-binding chemotaxis protein CheW [Leptolyngbya sp. FACHB-16]|nr:purine-binding chemotaxis protein CheW [Leptolyngbya sp. FACHB-8]MBD2157600.1 purine-binding chemotaxis protein CheW [Leptolyngbya sp. FACHB-16]
MLNQLEYLTQVDQSQRGTLQFLRFPVDDRTHAMLPVEQLTEVLTLASAQVVPIPDMPAWVLGVYNWRGEILWIVDMGQLLGVRSLHQHSTVLSSYMVLVAQPQRSGSSARLGLAVRTVDDLHWCDPSDIASPPPAVITPHLVPFLRGYTLGTDGEMLLALDITPLFEGQPFGSAVSSGLASL